MYDDYDLEYNFSNENIIDEDTYYEMYHGARTLMDNDDDEYARESHDYDALAYKHYA